MTLNSFLSHVPEITSSRIIELTPSRKGPVTLSIDGKMVHSSFDPEKESKRTAAQTESENIVLFGYGLGYTAKALIENNEKVETIIVFEPDPDLLASIYSAAKEDFYSHTSLFICNSIAHLEQLLTSITDKPELIINAYYRKEYSELAGKVDECLKKNAHRDSINTNTLNRFSKLWTKNILINAQKAFDNPGVNQMSDSFSDIPILLCAGGPTLSELGSKLKDIQKRCLIIAVDTAVRYCEAQGVHPDIIVVVDPQYWNSRHLDHCITEKSILIHDVSSHPGVFDFSARKRFISVPPFPLAELFQSNSRIQGTLGSGGSVASTAWSLASCISRGTVYCSGLDFSFPDMETHFKGSLFEERVHTHSNRLKSCDFHSFHALRDGSPFAADNASGGSVLSDQRLIMYKWWFDKQPKNKAYLLSGRGLPINGFDICDIDAILELPERRNEIDMQLSKLESKPIESYDFSTTIKNLKSGLIHLEKHLLEGIESLDNNEEIDFTLIDKIDAVIQDSNYKNIPGFTLEYEHQNTGLKDNYRYLYRNYHESITTVISLLSTYILH